MRHRACQDSLGRELDHRDPTDLAVAYKNVGDIGSVEETEEDLEGLAVGLVSLAVVDFDGEQELVQAPMLEDEIRSKEVRFFVSTYRTTQSMAGEIES